METLELVLRKPAAGPFGLALQSHGKDPGVKSATPGSNAQQGGLTAGDTIVSINGQNVTGFGITQAVKALREVTGEFKMVVRRRASGVPAALRGKEEPRAPTVAESNKRESPASTLPECAAHASAIAGTSKSHERDEMHSPESPPTIPDGPLPTDSNEYLPATGIEAHTIVPGAQNVGHLYPYTVHRYPGLFCVGCISWLHHTVVDSVWDMSCHSSPTHASSSVAS
eukprot:m.467431 g.467431  ORF g.467431 m.467431 type:complete len:226 (-) comp21640_c0_seq1:1411-2088(-)